MTDSVLNVGVIGTSWWSDAMYLPALQNLPHAHVAAVAGRDEARTQAFAQKWNISGAYHDYEKMLESESLDAILILSQNKEHFPMTMKAIERGLIKTRLTQGTWENEGLTKWYIKERIPWDV